MRYIDIVGSPSPLPVPTIPTNRDIVRYILYRKEQDEIKNFRSNTSIFNTAAVEIVDLYRPFLSSVILTSSIVRLALRL